MNSTAAALHLADLFAAYLERMRAEAWRQSTGGPTRPRGPRHPPQHGRRAPDTTTTMVCYLLVTLLVASAVLAVGEVLRDWWYSIAVKVSSGAGRPDLECCGGRCGRQCIAT